VKNKQRAFSLIELSISLLIIALLMSIVAGSIKLISSSRLTNARSLTSRSPVPNIPGLVAWYETSRLESFKPTEAVEDGQISAWYDTSPESITKQRNTLSRTASAAVTYQPNGIGKLPGVYFNGTNSISLTNFYQGTSTQNTIFFVAKPLALSSSIVSMVVDSGCGGPIASVALFQSASIEFHLQNTAYPALPSMASTGTDYLIAAYYNGASSRAYVNDATNMAGGTTFNLGTTNVLTGLSVGGRCTDYTFNGLVSEVIIYNRPLQNQERRDVMSYLAQKYNLKISGL
jgi:prepilin-type N-terminal cleavage/methylation domain-containing protein